MRSFFLRAAFLFSCRFVLLSLRDIIRYFLLLKSLSFFLSLFYLQSSILNIKDATLPFNENRLYRFTDYRACVIHITIEEVEEEEQ